MSSKIPEATDKIKKKLSFNDVKPVYQLAVETAGQKECAFSSLDKVELGESLVCQQNSMSAIGYNSLPLDHKEDVAVHQSNINQTSLLVSHPASEEVNHINSKCESMTAIEAKKKATYYLTEKAHKLMDEMFIKSIAMGKKKDKSALACEAIELLYQKEIG